MLRHWDGFGVPKDIGGAFTVLSPTEAAAK
jgi:hypothetical protein